MQDRQRAEALVTRQLAELDRVVAQARNDLNAVRGGERLEQWKSATVALLAQQLDPETAARFERTSPGPSFSQDLLEEVTDAAETYREALQAILRALATGGR